MATMTDKELVDCLRDPKKDKCAPCLELQKRAVERLDTLLMQNQILRSRDMPIPCTHEASLPRDYTCPICKNVVSTRERWGESIIYVVPKYCHFCGQRVCKEEDCEETLYLNAYVRHES